MVHKNMRRFLSWIMAVCLILSMLPTAFADGASSAVDVATWDDLESAVTSASGDITINLTSDVSVDTTSFPSSEHTVTITSNDNKALKLNAILTIASGHVVLQNLRVIVATKSKYLKLSDGKLDIYNCTFSLEAEKTSYFINEANTANTSPELNIYSGTFLEGPTTPLYLNGGTVNFSPTGNITISGDIKQTKYCQGFNIKPQDGYTITNAIFNGTDITAQMNAEYSVGTVTSATTYTGLSIEVENSGTDDPAPASGVTYTNGDLTVNGNVGYGGTVEVDQETGDFTFTATQDGTYNYVLDQVFVDGIALTDSTIQGEASYTWNVSELAGDSDTAAGEGTVDGNADGETTAETVTGTHSIVATFAYTVNFQSPANGTLSVSRGGETLTSGSIVRGGDVLTITATPADGYALAGELVLTGITKNSDGTYTVTAQNGEATPSISVSFVEDEGDGDDGSEPSKQQLPTPTITSEAGDETVDRRAEDIVKIACSESGATIYYTTDGTDPSTSDTRTEYSDTNMYNSLQSLPSGQVPIKAIAVKDGWLDSEIAEATFTIIDGTEPHSITVLEGNDGITFTVDGKSNVTTASKGAIIKVSVTPPEGKVLSKLTYAYGSSAEDITSTKQFAMPYADVTIEAEYDDVKYTITAGDGISFTVNGQTGVTEAPQGATVAVNVTITDGQRLTGLAFVYGSSTVDITSERQFTMPAASVTITAEYEIVYSCTAYVGSSIYLITYKPESLVTGVVTYGENAMLCDEANDRWVYLVNSADESLSESSFTVDLEGTLVSVPDGSDLNGNGKADILDAQIAYDVAGGVYELNGGNMKILLQADVNGDGQVTEDDAQAIQDAILEAFSAE